MQAEFELKKDSNSITNKNNGRKSVNNYNIDNDRIGKNIRIRVINQHLAILS